MRIAFDATAMPRNRAGAGVYTYHLARALAANLSPDATLDIFDRWGAFNDIGGRRGVRLHPARIASRGRRMLWEQGVLPRALRQLGADVLHAPHHSMPALALGWKTVVTVHDVTFRLLPWRYTAARRIYMSAVTSFAARRADAVIVPSHSVAADFQRLYGGNPARVTVVYEAPSATMRHIEDRPLLDSARVRLDLPDRFILSVGTREPGKNRVALLRAFAVLRQRGLKHELVIAGQRGWRDDSEARLIERLGLGDSVRYIGFVPDTDLPLVYNLAAAFVFPSWREGFGLPPLEALACGTPVVASNRRAMPEVLADAALYAAPDNPSALAGALERVLTDEGLRERLRARGLQHAAVYSWERAARETVAVYHAALGGRSG